MSSAYALRSPLYLTGRSFGLSFLRDEPSNERKRSIDFHVVSGDYFGTLATVVGLVADTLSSDDNADRERCAKNLSDLREDLVYLQDRYTIERKR